MIEGVVPAYVKIQAGTWLCFQGHPESASFSCSSAIIVVLSCMAGRKGEQESEGQTVFF